MGILSYGYKALKSGVGQAINKTKTNVPKTKIQKATRDLKIGTQKLKAGKAKLDQTVFEMKNDMPITFKSKKGKSESNKESYKRIQKDNTKVLKGMIDKATENKKDGGRMGYKSGNKDGVGRDHGGTTLKLKNKKFFMLGDSKKDQKKYYDMSRAGARDMNKTGQGEKFRDATTVDKKTGQIKIKRDEKKAMGGRIGLKKGSFPDHSGDGKITKKDILMAKGVIPKSKNKKSKKKFI